MTDSPLEEREARAEPVSDWTPEQIALLKADPVLHAMSMGDLDALLTPEEKAAMQEHLTNLANQRRRVEAESRGIALP